MKKKNRQKHWSWDVVRWSIQENGSHEQGENVTAIATRHQWSSCSTVIDNTVLLWELFHLCVSLLTFQLEVVMPHLAHHCYQLYLRSSLLTHIHSMWRHLNPMHVFWSLCPNIVSNSTPIRVTWEEHTQWHRKAVGGWGGWSPTHNFGALSHEVIPYEP